MLGGAKLAATILGQSVATRAAPSYVRRDEIAGRQGHSARPVHGAGTDVGGVYTPAPSGYCKARRSSLASPSTVP